MMNDNNSIYINNLPPNITENELDSQFQQYGNINSIIIKQSAVTDKYYAYIEFDSVKCAEDAIKHRNGYKLGEYRIFVDLKTNNIYDKSLSLRLRGPPVRTEFRVIVENLPGNVDWKNLKDFMRKAGSVGFADIIDGKGYVEYENKDDMKWALKNLDKKEFQTSDSVSVIRVYPSALYTSLPAPRPKNKSKTSNRASYRSRSKSRSRDRSMGSSRSRSSSWPRRRSRSRS